MRMIQPINTLTPRVGFRGSNGAYGTKTGIGRDSSVALINAGGVALAAGGITTTVARAYTKSWAQAGVLGLFGAFLTMFFMTPHLIEKINVEKAAAKKYLVEPQVAKSSKDTAKVIKEHIIPVKKLVQFRSDKAPTS